MKVSEELTVIPETVPKRGRAQRGYLLMATAMASIVMMGAAGLAVDLGRMYIAKNETQSYTDAAAVLAALELDGTQYGFEDARDAVATSTNRWNFDHDAFTDPIVEFAQDQTGPWDPAPANAAGYRFARVVAEVDVPMSFMRVAGSGPTRPVSAVSIAGQVPKTSFREGLFPFSPFAHPPGPSRVGDYDEVTGLTVGGTYTLRWGAGAQSNNPVSTCPDDRYDDVIDIAKAGGGEERGFIEDASASIIRQSIVADYQTVFREIGDAVWMTGGAKQTQQDALVERVRQDGDRVADTWSEYYGNGDYAHGGNGRRLVAAPINLGAPGGYIIVQIGAFFLRDEDTYLSANGGNKPFCAELVGGYVEGGRGPAAGGLGYWVVRLVSGDS